MTSKRSAMTPVCRPRRGGLDLAAFTRTKLVGFKIVAGWSCSQIKTKYPSILISTIKSIVYLGNKCGKNESLPRSGQPRILDYDDKARLLNAIDENTRITYDDLLSELGNEVKKGSFRRLLVEEGRRKWLVIDRPGLAPFHVAQ